MKVKILPTVCMTWLLCLPTSVIALQTDQPPLPILATDNSAVFAQYGPTLDTIPELVAKYKKANRPAPVLISQAPRTHGTAGRPDRNSSYPAQTLIDLAETSSVVIKARAGLSKTLMKADGSFLYTNYVFSIDEVLLDRTGKFVAGDQIYVTRAGGTTTVDGLLVQAVDTEFTTFGQGGKYVLFLTPVPGTVFFKAIAPASFKIASKGPDSAAVEGLDAHPLREIPTSATSIDSFIQEIYDAIARALAEGTVSK